MISSLTSPNVTCLDSVLNYDEDSVDIYSGLEDSPKKNKDNGEHKRDYMVVFC